MLSKVAILLLFLGILPRFRPHISVETCVSLPLLRQEWGTRLAHNVRHCSAAQRLGLHAPRSAGYCLTPTADLSKSERGPISRSGPSVFSMLPNRAISSEKSNFSSPHAAAQPLNILSRPETFNASSSRRPCRMALRRDAYPLFIPIPMSVLTILVSHLVDRFPDGILTSSSGPQPVIQRYCHAQGVTAGLRRAGRN